MPCPLGGVPPLRAQATDDLEQGIHGRRLPQHVLDAHLLPHRIGIVGRSREGHDGDTGDRGVLELVTAKPPAICSRHADIEDDEANVRTLTQQRKRFCTVGGLTCLVPLEPEQLCEPLPGAERIVHNQHCRQLSHGPF
jgi:hypothetical protein